VPVNVKKKGWHAYSATCRKDGFTRILNKKSKRKKRKNWELAPT
jgi:hypothetical protein